MRYPTHLVISLNLLRRHLSDEQRAYIAAKYLKPVEEAKARERQGERTDLDPDTVENFPESGGRARDLAAAQVGLSGKTVAAAARALKDGVPVLEAALERDKLVAEWVELTEEKLGQNDQVSTGGRGHKEGASEAARPVEGKTEDAKGKNVERSLKVASFLPRSRRRPGKPDWMTTPFSPATLFV